jgi:hypothetical protein
MNTPGGFLKMVWCQIAGHDDRVVRAPDRLRLRCDYCGRATAGWTLSSRPGLQNERMDGTRKWFTAAPVGRRLGSSQPTRS